MAMIKGFVPAPGIGVQQIVKQCNSLSYYYYLQAHKQICIETIQESIQDDGVVDS
jgi:hypothetical protein